MSLSPVAFCVHISISWCADMMMTSWKIRMQASRHRHFSIFLCADSILSGNVPGCIKLRTCMYTRVFVCSEIYTHISLCAELVLASRKIRENVSTPTAHIARINARNWCIQWAKPRYLPCQVPQSRCVMCMCCVFMGRHNSVILFLQIASMLCMH